jgi:hypothetical protein
MERHTHADAVLSLLHERLCSSGAQAFVTPFGTPLHPASGRFAPGEAVLAPGVDDLRPRQPAEVVACGTRSDYAGVWCLLRLAGAADAYALVAEEHLRRRVRSAAWARPGRRGAAPALAAFSPAG